MPQIATNMSIEVKNISKLYGSQKALDSVSFTIKPGEIAGLLGPNGAGKSTMMKIITCFIPPTSGDVSVYGFNIFDHSIEIREKIGYLPENNPLYLDMYVKEYLEFIAKIHKIKSVPQRVKEIIEITGLGVEQNKKIAALSKGFRQRVGLAQALIHDPEVLILDEPTSGLDPNQIIEIRNLIKEIGRQKTIIFSTHILQEVEAICTRAIIIDKGKIVADDSTQHLNSIFTPKNIISVEFDKPVNKEKLLAIKGVTKVLLQKECNFILEAEANQDVRPLIFNFAVENKIAVISMKREESGLENVFQQLTKK